MLPGIYALMVASFMYKCLSPDPSIPPSFFFPCLAVLYHLMEIRLRRCNLGIPWCSHRLGSNGVYGIVVRDSSPDSPDSSSLSAWFLYNTESESESESEGTNSGWLE